ncbi:MAG: ferredoxin [Desulfovibrio sp.]|uniref:ferredoxin n=1 Tax=Desulfovibrio sp. 7SRBS1 TaxID=3378064 RepID=UPI003B41C1DB
MSKTVTLNEDDCIGCQACVDICPGVFGFIEGEGKALVINPDGGTEEEILEAMDICPVSCISWEED